MAHFPEKPCRAPESLSIRRMAPKSVPIVLRCIALRRSIELGAIQSDTQCNGSDLHPQSRR